MTQKDSKTILAVKDVYKDFYLPHEKGGSLKGAIVNALRSRDREFDTQHALRGVSFDIKEGEFFGILGRNGSGKSTLLKILAGIYQPTSGRVENRGKIVPFIELGVGFNPELTGRENVYLNGALLGFSEKEIDDRYEEIVRFAELEDFMEQKLKNYSSGMQVRLAFSVATRAEADILLIDEVLAVGDAEFQRKCYNYFELLKKSKSTVVFVSHDMSAVREFCDRAILIEDSRLIDQGDADKIATSYSRLFMNEEDGEIDGVSQTNDRWGDRRASFTEVTVTGRKVIDDNVKKLTFSVEFIANQDIQTIITGSSIVNSKGEEVCGTNTEHRHIKLTELRKGEVVKVHWEYPNIFTDGKYTINVSLHGSNSTRMADWWEGAAAFIVKREEKAPFVVTPDIQLKIERSI